jgi:hypothetical protein
LFGDGQRIAVTITKAHVNELIQAHSLDALLQVAVSTADRVFSVRPLAMRFSLADFAIRSSEARLHRVF